MLTDNTRTPGPWRAVPIGSSGKLFDIIDAEGYVIATATSKADAALMVASREMRAALRNFVAFAEYHDLRKLFPRIETQLCEMRGALAKVE
jgi:hypothetical protein